MTTRYICSWFDSLVRHYGPVQRAAINPLNAPPTRRPSDRAYERAAFVSDIRINVLSPGPTLTERAAKVVGRDAMVEMGSTTPIGHVGDPSEVPAAAAFLASSDNSFMTGSKLFTDGGLAKT